MAFSRKVQSLGSGYAGQRAPAQPEHVADIETEQQLEDAALLQLHLRGL